MSLGAEQILTRLAHALAPNIPGGAGQGDEEPKARLCVATVLFGEAGPPPTFTITMDGVNPRRGVPTMADIRVGDTVWVLEQPPALVIVGPYVASVISTGTPFRVGTSQLGSTYSLDQQ